MIGENIMLTTVDRFYISFCRNIKKSNKKKEKQSRIYMHINSFINENSRRRYLNVHRKGKGFSFNRWIDYVCFFFLVFFIKFRSFFLFSFYKLHDTCNSFCTFLGFSFTVWRGTDAFWLRFHIQMIIHLLSVRWNWNVYSGASG